MRPQPSTGVALTPKPPLPSAVPQIWQCCRGPTFPANFMQQHVEGPLLRQRLPKMHHLDGYAHRCGRCQQFGPQVLLCLGRTSRVSTALHKRSAHGGPTLANAPMCCPAGAHLGWQQRNAHYEVASIGSRPAVIVIRLPAAAFHALCQPALTRNTALRCTSGVCSGCATTTNDA